MFLSGMLGFLGWLILLVLNPFGPWGWYLDSRAFLIVMGGTLGMGVAAMGGRNVLHALWGIGLIFRSTLPKTAPSLAPLLDQLYRLIYISATLGMLMGGMGLLAHMDDPERIGLAMVTSLNSMIYALLWAEGVVRPAQCRLTILSVQSGTPPIIKAERDPFLFHLLAWGLALLLPLLLLFILLRAVGV